MYIYIFIHINIYIYINVCMGACLCFCLCLCVSVSVCVFMPACMSSVLAADDDLHVGLYLCFVYSLLQWCVAVVCCSIVMQ